METNRWIGISRRVYAKLLYLYPEEHYTEYGADMLQVFTDQCKSIDRARKGLGFVGLWIRSLIDLVINVFREHLSAPYASLGLLEAVPNAPLSWKGVLLVLIPGLIFFSSQVAQLTGKDWFFLMAHRAGYFMIIPVLLVWAWKRIFPIWGLIPLGLLFKTLLDFSYRLQLIAQAPPFTYISNYITNPISRWLIIVARVFPSSTLKIMIVIVLLLTILVLLWSTKQRAGIPVMAWIWLGIFFLLMGLDVFKYGKFFNPLLDIKYFLELIYYLLYIYGGLLVIILLGALLARRHGRLAILLPLGYLLPTILYGRISNEWPAPSTPEFSFMLSVSATILVYRSLVALAGPLWIVRSATGQMQKRASVISLAALIIIQAISSLVMLYNSGWKGDQLITVYIVISGQLIVGAGIALALVLYRKDLPLQTA